MRLPWRPAARLAVVMLLISWPVLVAGLLKKPAGSAALELEKCPLMPMAEFLADETSLRDAPQWVMAFVDYGPEILYDGADDLALAADPALIADEPLIIDQAINRAATW